MDYLSADKILIVDLAASETTEDELDEDLVSEKIGGAGMTKHLYEQHEDEDPIVIGTGLLTGTLYPATAAGVITAKSPVSGTLCHCPITLKLGVEIKYSGFDYIVLKGVSDKPIYLWVHDGVADIQDAADVWGKDVWETTDAWRKIVGDDLLQTLVIGKSGESGSDYAQVCFNHWSSGDRWGFGKAFGGKNIKGAAFRGMGLLEAAKPEEFVERSLEILKAIKPNDFMGKRGVGDICAALGHEDVTDWLAPIVHRHSACYNTPYPTNTFAYLDDDPKLVTETKVKEPGILITDIFGLIGFKNLGLSAADSCRALKACAKYGIDPTAVAELSPGKSLEDVENAFARLSGSPPIAGKGVFSPWCPTKPLFGDFGLSGGDETANWWERHQALASIFGIHPIFAVMCPQLTEENMLELANIGTDLELDKDTLDEVIDGLCG